MKGSNRSLTSSKKHATHTIEVTINSHHRSKRRLIGERNHSADNPGFLNGWPKEPAQVCGHFPTEAPRPLSYEYKEEVSRKRHAQRHANTSGKIFRKAMRFPWSLRRALERRDTLLACSCDFCLLCWEGKRMRWIVSSNVLYAP